ncbi:hypothetical protein [Bacillus massiliglaciei]|uniref:hypothetical protein n=1 Tax=Bacillus massiliglaciei TaxID=1816693 RepID=UPI000DA603E1|nr:hypothetical protein [Bacillus massiliglaciei]
MVKDTFLHDPRQDYFKKKREIADMEKEAEDYSVFFRISLQRLREEEKAFEDKIVKYDQWLKDREER